MAINPSEVKEIIGRHMLADGFDIIFDTDKSHGVYVHDAASGRDYLDLFSCVASIPLGYNHPKLMEPAFLERLARVAVNKISLSDLYSVELAEFVDTFSRLAKPPEFKHMFFVEGGSVAVENAFKTAMDWKIRLNISRGDTRFMGTKVIHFNECFHGRTGYTICTTNTDPAKTMYFAKLDWPRVPNPKITFPLKEHLEEVEARESRALRRLEEILDRESEDVCAIVIEPIQGEGGDNHFRDEFFIELRRLCDEYDVLLIFDEVQTGIGLTGKMWCYQHFSVVPDIIAFGKKTQVCGIMATDRIDSVPDNVFHVSSRINSTWGGSIVDMYRFKRILEVIDEDDLIGNVERVSTPVIEMLEELQNVFPQMISNARARGFFAAFDIVNADVRQKLMKTIWGNGAMLLTSGWNSLRLRPSLIFSEEDVRTASEILHKSCEQVVKEVGKDLKAGRGSGSQMGA